MQEKQRCSKLRCGAAWNADLIGVRRSDVSRDCKRFGRDLRRSYIAPTQLYSHLRLWSHTQRLDQPGRIPIHESLQEFLRALVVDSTFRVNQPILVLHRHFRLRHGQYIQA